MFRPADLFYLPPDPHLKCFQSFDVIISEDLRL